MCFWDVKPYSINNDFTSISPATSGRYRCTIWVTSGIADYAVIRFIRFFCLCREPLCSQTLCGVSIFDLARDIRLFDLINRGPVLWHGKYRPGWPINIDRVRFFDLTEIGPIHSHNCTFQYSVRLGTFRLTSYWQSGQWMTMLLSLQLSRLCMPYYREQTSGIYWNRHRLSP